MSLNNTQEKIFRKWASNRLNINDKNKLISCVAFQEENLIDAVNHYKRIEDNKKKCYKYGRVTAYLHGRIVDYVNGGFIDSEIKWHCIGKPTCTPPTIIYTNRD